MKVAVIGTGSWGTALANLLADKGHDVVMLARREEVAEAINRDHRNPSHLSDSLLNSALRATTSHEVACGNADALIVVTPSTALRNTLSGLAGSCASDVPVVICTKGLEQGSGKLLSSVCLEELGNAERIAVLSGPNHAEEIIKGIPAGSVIASANPKTATFCQQLFSTPVFRTYTSEDIRGVQLCAAFKNVIAISVGISYGLGFGDNTAALLITRGMAEMSRLINAVGGDPLTAIGLAGAGDMVATCMSKHSRNRTFGEAFAGGETLDEYRKRTNMVVEGAFACKSLNDLSKHHNVDLPITNMVRAILREGVDVSEAKKLLVRPLKQEQYGL